uniref:Uncharacterized protein n=1 Tax=Globisporangium ultimum (strain ATCC 200006 / CBS 805.95 / DAOM BR144) TaxID=431595 RepID=K3WHE2_GLOUD
MMNPLGNHGGANGGTPSRYDDLLRQIVQLNTDLQKTAALSQTLQRERDGLQHNNGKARTLKDEVKRLHDRCDKLQLVLMQETEQKIDSDKKHEELITKWKHQLEMKARAFEGLQKKFAPPKDLEQLRFKIQEELEGPHQQRVDNLQEEIEKHRQFAFNMRREYEILKTEYEQFTIDQGNEVDCLHATYEMKVNDLKKKLQVAEECAQDSHNVELIRQLKHQKETAAVEIKLLQDELREARGEIMRVHEQSGHEKAENSMRLADEMAKNATLELDYKALSRQMSKLKDGCESLRSKWNASQSKLHELTSECESFRDQMKQKDLLVFNSHNSHTAKLREERTTWEREQTSLKDRVNELSLKLQAAEALVEKASAASLQAKENEISSAEYTSLLKAREEEVEKYRSHAAALEKKVAHREEEFRHAQHEAEESIHKLQLESENVRKMLQTLEAEKEHYVAKQNSSQELLTRMKSECMVLRTKLKEVENDYRTLQAKHREVIQYHEDIQLEKEQMEAKLKYVEQDFALLSEKLGKEKESHANSTRELQRNLSHLEADFRSQKAALKQEMRTGLSKALKELSKTQKKRDAYKRKCMEVHERYKALLQETNFQESRLLQLKHDHTIELQQLLGQLSEAEGEKTALMQRQIELGAPPPISTKKSIALRDTELSSRKD